MISVLIAGSYTPICLLVLKGTTGIILLSIVWGIAIFGILIKAFWINCPNGSLLCCISEWAGHVFSPLQIVERTSPAAFGWLLAGGIIYTIGGIIYALKLPIFNSRHKNSGLTRSSICLLMGGSICHFIVMYVFILKYMYINETIQIASVFLILQYSICYLQSLLSSY